MGEGPAMVGYQAGRRRGSGITRRSAPRSPGRGRRRRRHGDRRERGAEHGDRGARPGASSASSWYLEAPTATPIKHVVVLFDENKSFDHYFGTYPNATNTDGSHVPRQAGTPKVNGLYTKITPTGRSARC